MRLAFIGIGQGGAPLADQLEGKILLDCTNLVGPDWSHGLASARSGSEVIQARVPSCRVEKAFTIEGFENFEDSAYPATNVKPVMLFCGNDGDAKATGGDEQGRAHAGAGGDGDAQMHHGGGGFGAWPAQC